MFYLFFQTFFWILAAFILGLLIGWWFCGRCKCNKSTASQTNVRTTAAVDTGAKRAAAAASTTAATSVAATKAVDTSADAGEVSDNWKPQGFSSRPSDADELKRIKGVGPVIEKTLNGLGIYQFKQIAAFTNDNISWVENYLAFPGRIEREEWISQAKALAEGRETEFSKRVDKGDLDY